MVNRLARYELKLRNMIKDVILTFDDSIVPVRCDDLFTFQGGHDFTKLSSLEAKVDTRELTLSFLGDTFPNMRKLRLNNSIIPSVRDIGCTLVHLRFLSLARCNITSLDGISTLSQSLEELYLAFNHITDVCDLMGMDKLTIIDLEDNEIPDVRSVEVLTLCSGLKALTLSGNPAADAPDYRESVAKLLPQVVYLDEKRLRPKKPKTPRPPRPPSKSPPCEEGGEAVAPRQKRLSPERQVHIQEPPPPPVPKLTKEEKEDREHIMTEMLDDLVEDRPPSARGYYGPGAFPGIGKSPQKSPKLGQKLVAGPRIVRPMSAKGRPI